MKVCSFLLLTSIFLHAQTDPAFDAYQAWNRLNLKLDPASRATALFDLSSKWVADWPDSKFAWEQFRNSLLFTGNQSPELWKSVDENLIRLYPPHTFAGAAASDWVALGINLKEAEALIINELEWQESQPRPAAGSKTPSLSFVIDEAAAASKSFSPLCTLASVQIRLRKFEEAKATIERVRKWLEGDFVKHFDQDPLEAFPDYRAKYFVLCAELAKEEGKLLNALAYYQKVISNPWFHREYGGYVKSTHDLWTKAGGGEDGWKEFATVPPLPPGVPAGYPGIPFLPWLSVHYKLPDMKPSGPDSNIWTSKTFEGKVTFVYLWASWCGPCWNHLPSIQLLYEKTKTRRDISVLTLSVDEDTEKLAAFMKEKKYNFPVVANKSYADELLPQMVLGQQWLVDRDGTIRLLRATSVIAPEAFVDEAMYKLTQLAKDNLR